MHQVSFMFDIIIKHRKVIFVLFCEMGMDFLWAKLGDNLFKSKTIMKRYFGNYSGRAF